MLGSHRRSVIDCRSELLGSCPFLDEEFTFVGVNVSLPRSGPGNVIVVQRADDIIAEHQAQAIGL